MFFGHTIDTINKIDRNILNIKYDIKSIIEKLDKMHEDLYSNNIGNKQQISSMANDEEDFQISINNQLPLKDEDGLLFFEEKLTDISFRNKMVKYDIYIYHPLLTKIVIIYYFIKYIFLIAYNVHRLLN